MGKEIESSYIRNFSRLCSECKQKEFEDMLSNHNLDVAGQACWEKEETRINVEGYKLFGKPRSNQNSLRGEGGGERLLKKM